MTHNKHLLCAGALTLCIVAGTALSANRASTATPRDTEGDTLATTEDTMPEFQPLEVGNSMPATFRHTNENAIEDSSHCLLPFFRKLAANDRPVRIVHIGDSHVRGHVFPVVARHLLEDDFGSEAVEPDKISYQTSGLATETGLPGLVYHIYGINGAEAETFADADKVAKIAALNPDLLIISFGTNEAYGRNYRADEHKAQLANLLSMLATACPEASMLLTTPPGGYARGRRTPTGNPNTPIACSVIKECASQRGAAVWDMFSIVGGRTDACRNWTRVGMLRRDGVHFTPDGYTLQAKLLHEALAKAYNDCMTRTPSL